MDDLTIALAAHYAAMGRAGGQARAKNLTTAQLSKIGRKGAKAKARKRRSEIARMGAQARHAKRPESPTNEG